ncbi:hypothetical protein [Rhizorhapis suberifaciens]|uniref:Uncharacterized protein n=1 Tax=Rhizorhapis suberifaciens TaxID=13656 RepID=A0A840HY86_9SPHN|nr:hypothetical protein [Rhizorhapis suberifaciens]MBB4642520.1 hypothetical protein [Rhizorhapis suberifaciens]
MPWSHRLLYPIAIIVAATPPLLSTRLVRSSHEKDTLSLPRTP